MSQPPSILSTDVAMFFFLPRRVRFFTAVSLSTWIASSVTPASSYLFRHDERHRALLAETVEDFSWGIPSLLKARACGHGELRLFHVKQAFKQAKMQNVARRQNRAAAESRGEKSLCRGMSITQKRARCPSDGRDGRNRAEGDGKAAHCYNLSHRFSHERRIHGFAVPAR